MERIYLVEDDKILANFTKVALCKNGYEVMVFHDARKAIESAKQNEPDCILMDIMLPHVSGGEAVKELSKNPNLKNIPVVFLTGLVSHEEDLEKTGITVDGNNYRTLGKPYEINQLLEVVEKSLMEIKR